jgi:hypothetical protein
MISFHISWLEFAIENFKKNNKYLSAIYGGLTIQEFIEIYAKEEFNKCVKVD